MLINVSRVAAMSAVQQPSHKATVLASKEGCGQGAQTHLSVSQTKLSQAEAYVFA
jgi:hypothetical protein